MIPTDVRSLLKVKIGFLVYNLFLLEFSIGLIFIDSILAVSSFQFLLLPKSNLVYDDVLFLVNDGDVS